MSLEAMLWAWKAPVKGTKKLVLLCLADHADADGECWPALDLICERTGVSRSYAQDTIRSLALEDKLIERAPRYRENESQSSNLYRLLMVDSSEQESEATESAGRAGGPDIAGPQGPGGQGPLNPQIEPSEESGEATPTPPVEQQDPVRVVWSRYVNVMEPRSRELDAEGRRLINEALKVATVAELCRAIDGCRSSSFHMGDNAKRKKYNRLSQIIKGRRGRETTRERIDFFIDLADKAGVESGFTSADPARIRQARRDVLDAWEFPNDEHVARRGETAAKWLEEQGMVIETGDDGRPTFRWAQDGDAQ